MNYLLDIESNGQRVSVMVGREIRGMGMAVWRARQAFPDLVLKRGRRISKNAISQGQEDDKPE
jgi:hypothetical protein